MNRCPLPRLAVERSLCSRSVKGCRMTKDAPILIPGVKRQSLSGGSVDLSMIAGSSKPKAKRFPKATTHSLPVLTRADKRQARNRARKLAAKHA